MDDTAQFVSNLNVARFADKLQGEYDPATRALLHRLLFEEWNKSGFNLKQLGKMRRQMIEGSARIAVQKAIVKTLAANSQDVQLAELTLRNLVEIQRIFEERHQAIVNAIHRSNVTALDKLTLAPAIPRLLPSLDIAMPDLRHELAQCPHRRNVRTGGT